MNKAVKVILTILIVVAGFFFFFSFIYMTESIEYAKNKAEVPFETDISVFEYRLEHKAYDEVLTDFYLENGPGDMPEGEEALYRVGEYAHTAFMSRVYAEKGDKDKVRSYDEKLKSIRSELGEYEYTADEIDELIRNAP